MLRRTLLAVLALAICAADTGTDRKALLDHLNQSSSDFASSIKGMSEAQWKYKPAPDAWSVAECAEHIALTEDLLRDMVSSKVLAAPPRKTPSDPAVLDEKVVSMVTNRTSKFKAPEPLKPSGQFANADAVLQKFNESRQKTLTLAASRTDLREHATPHPALQELDAHQWLLYLSGHTMRHTAQIREVKASPGFPKD